jgi:hypothetical protein
MFIRLGALAPKKLFYISKSTKILNYTHILTKLVKLVRPTNQIGQPQTDNPPIDHGQFATWFGCLIVELYCEQAKMFECPNISMADCPPIRTGRFASSDLWTWTPLWLSQTVWMSELADDPPVGRGQSTTLDRLDRRWVLVRLVAANFDRQKKKILNFYEVGRTYAK